MDVPQKDYLVVSLLNCLQIVKFHLMEKNHIIPQYQNGLLVTIHINKTSLPLTQKWHLSLEVLAVTLLLKKTRMNIHKLLKKKTKIDIKLRPIYMPLFFNINS